MATCQSCGGVIGVDCFNPSECAWITEQQNREHQQISKIVCSDCGKDFKDHLCPICGKVFRT